MAGFILEAFQRKAVTEIKARFAQVKRVLLQSATGSGKTVMAVDFVRDWMEANPGKNVLCLFNLQCLLPQFEDTFKKHGLREEVSIYHDDISRAKDGTFFVDHQKAPQRRIMLTMPETLARTLKGQGSKDLTLDEDWFNKVGLILIDEAHKGTSENFQMIRDALPDAIVLGLTATPMRVKNKDGECLANDWGYELVTTVSIRELIQMKRLVAPLYYDLDEDAHLFREWQNIVEKHSAEDGNRQTIWFCKGVKEAKDWEFKLLEIGETCAIVTSVANEELGTTSQTAIQREAIYKEFETQKITHLISIQALCEGFDAPIAKYVIIDRGVGNKALYQQILGRAMRPYEGKLNAHIIDRCGNHLDHGDIEDYEWDLEAQAAEASVVKLDGKRVISEEKFREASYIRVKCETVGCPSVYNAKRHVDCPHCKTAHGLKVESAAGAWISSILPQAPQKAWGNIMEQIRKGMSGDIKAVMMLLQNFPDLFDDDADGIEFRPDIKPVLTELSAMRFKSDKDFRKPVRWAA